MKVETMDLVIIIFSTIFAIIGLVIAFLQKRGNWSTGRIGGKDGYTSTNGGKIALAGIVVGAFMISEYSMLITAVYIAVLLGLYFVIQYKMKNK